jgi:hypothetical protein
MAEGLRVPNDREQRYHEGQRLPAMAEEYKLPETSGGPNYRRKIYKRQEPPSL